MKEMCGKLSFLQKLMYNKEKNNKNNEDADSMDESFSKTRLIKQTYRLTIF